MPGADDFRERVPGSEWDALKGGAAVGTVMSISTQGYSGPIAIAVGVDDRASLTGLRVLTHTETPGLGAKITGAAFSRPVQGPGAPRAAEAQKGRPGRGAGGRDHGGDHLVARGDQRRARRGGAPQRREAES